MRPFSGNSGQIGLSQLTLDLHFYAFFGKFWPNCPTDKYSCFEIPMRQNKYNVLKNLGNFYSWTSLNDDYSKKTTFLLRSL